MELLGHGQFVFLQLTAFALPSPESDPPFLQIDIFPRQLEDLTDPAVVGDIVQKRELPKKPSDVLKAVTLYGAGKAPYVRDLASAMWSGYDYRSGAIAGLFHESQAVWGAATAAKKKDRARKLLVHGLKAIGQYRGLPSDQMIFSLEGLMDMVEKKKNAGPARLLFRERRGQGK